MPPVAAATLRNANERAVSLWRELRQESPALSAPHLIDPPEEYWSTRKLFVVGQETYGWGEDVRTNQSNAVVVDQLLAGYRDFDLGARYSRSPFWQAANKVFAALNPGATRRAYVWTNLVKIDSDKRRPPSVVEGAMSSIGLLGAEVRAFTPEVVVFFTGPAYDDRLRLTFAGSSFEPAGGVISRVVHPALPRDTFRSYHPNYLRRSKRWTALDTIISLCGQPARRPRRSE